MKSFDWNGAEEATAGEQIDNAFVSKKEHDKLKENERLLESWGLCINWKMVKNFIDCNKDNPRLESIISVGTRWPAGGIGLRIKPLTYYKWLMLEEQNKMNMGMFLDEKINEAYEELKNKKTNGV